MTTLMWFRRDLRTFDQPALAAASAAGGVLACFVLDPRILASAGPTRTAWLAANLRALAADLDDRLCLRIGDPVVVLPQLAAEVGAGVVHVSTETEPGGSVRDQAVRAILAASGIAWQETGSPYAVTPGRVITKGGRDFRVFSAFQRAWREYGWPAPARLHRPPDLLAADSDPQAWKLVEDAIAASPVPLPPAGERAALARWAQFSADGLADYHATRDRPDLAGTSQLSGYLKLGVLHPRTLLTDLSGRSGAGAERFITELAWREFYAEVLWRHPESLTADLKPLSLPYDQPDAGFEAWRQGRTGYPIVDAGQRQLLATGWMHNRVRMISASFLTKDLHLWWPHGAAHFAEHLLDADLASNVHGWQWVAGTGTDAAPYFRVFNPTSQGERFDPSGDYVRAWVPELAHLGGAAVHRPGNASDGYACGYPKPILDHASERAEALARYRLSRAR